MNATLGLVISSSISNRSFQVLAYDLGKPTFLPQVHYHLNDYLKFEVTYGTLQGLLWLAYYFILDPIAAVSLIRYAVIADLIVNCHSSSTHPKRFCRS
jgi:2-hydroxy fatty acid dioxygenase